MNESIKKTLESLKRNKFEVEYYHDNDTVVAAILSEIDVNKSVGIGGSVTINSLDIPKKLAERGNRVFFHWFEETREKMSEVKSKARYADIYMSSANALTENGEIVNIDGQGNRVSSMIYGHEKMYVVCGRNKIVKDLQTALSFIKDNAYKNARRLNLNTPCAKTGKCSNCDSPQRMCRVTTIIERMPIGANLKVIIIDEDLGF